MTRRALLFTLAALLAAPAVRALDLDPPDGGAAAPAAEDAARPQNLVGDNPQDAAPAPPPALAFASTEAAAGLPPDAREPFLRGVAAVENADYPLAAQAFRDAFTAAPDSILIFRNAGLAEARIPGRELRAMSWLGAALAAGPDAADAALVRADIAALRARAAAGFVRFTQSVAAAAPWNESPYARARAQHDWGDALVAAGDLDGARKLAGQIQEPAQKGALLLSVAEAKRKAGDLGGAREAVDAAQFTAENDPSVWERRPLLGEVAIARAHLGQTADAATLFDLVSNDVATLADDAEESLKARLKLAAQRREAGLADAAGDDLAKARDFARKVRDPYTRDSGLQAVGEAQAALLDADGARRTAAALDDPYYKGLVMAALAEAEARAGDDAAARRAADDAPDLLRATALRRMAEAQMAKGRNAEALSTLSDAAALAAASANALDRTTQQAAIAGDMIRAGDQSGARIVLAAARKSQKKIPWNEDGGMAGPGSNQRAGKDAIAAVDQEIRRRERPWTVWTDEVTGPLDAPPFPDIAEWARGLDAQQDDPSHHLSQLLDASEAYRKERDRIDMLLAESPAAR